MGYGVSHAFAICLRACGLIREEQRKVFALAGRKSGSRGRLVVTNPANFWEARFWITSCLRTTRELNANNPVRVPGLRFSVRICNIGVLKRTVRTNLSHIKSCRM